MSKFDYQIQAEELIPCCPFCGEVLDGMIVNGMHARCNQEYAIELDLLDQPDSQEQIHQ